MAVCHAAANIQVPTACTHPSSKYQDKGLYGLVGYKKDLLLVLSGKDPSNDNIERFSLTPTVMNNIMDDRFPFSSDEDTNQAEMEDYDPADHARAPAQV